MKKKSAFLFAAIFFSMFFALAAQAEEVSTTVVDNNRSTSIEISDYFSVERIKELALSNDGRSIAYSVELRGRQVAHILSILDGYEQSSPLNIPERAYALEWHPSQYAVTFVAPENNVQRVFVLDLISNETQAITPPAYSVIRYKMSPDGHNIAFSARRLTGTNEKLNAPRGFKRKSKVFDFKKQGYFQLLNRRYEKVDSVAPIFCVQRVGDDCAIIDQVGAVSEFHWAKSGSKLSIVASSEDKKSNYALAKVWRVYIYDLSKRHLITRFEQHSTLSNPKGDRACCGIQVSLSGGQWTEDSQELFVLKLTRYGNFVSDIEYTLTSTKKFVWRRTPIDRDAVIVSVEKNSILFQDRDNGDLTFSRLSLISGNVERVLPDSELSQSKIACALARRRCVFIGESITSPPNIFLLENGRERQLTRFNSHLAGKAYPKVEELKISQADGSPIFARYIKPRFAEVSTPSPTLFFLRGSGSAIRNTFMPYFDYWPHAFLTYAEKGIGVVLVEYGEDLYKSESKDEYNHFALMMDEPVQRILTVIEFFVETGIADAQRLGIAGWSNGAWLGPKVMVDYKKFRAASFAEHGGSIITTYSTLSMEANEISHDINFGVSLWEDYITYVGVSPEMKFESTGTSVLFEAGELSAAILMMGNVKASAYFGNPTEFVVYPNSGHVLIEPDLQVESATANLDWFRFWLQDYEDLDPKKAEQYERWRTMRDKRCLRADLVMPKYCH